MPTEEQKRLWKKEKEQMLKDKQKQGREVRRRKKELKFGGVKKKDQPSLGTPPETTPDDILRKQLGL